MSLGPVVFIYLIKILTITKFVFESVDCQWSSISSSNYKKNVQMSNTNVHTLITYKAVYLCIYHKKYI